MSEAQTASQQITEEVTAWPGIEAGTGSRGEFAFKFGRREIGHLHGDRVAHFGFPKGVWAELKEQGRIGYHPVFPGKPGYATRKIESEADVRDVIALMRATTTAWPLVTARLRRPEGRAVRRAHPTTRAPTT
jgi:hypothetical protein